jgi:hypothetical protein
MRVVSTNVCSFLARTVAACLIILMGTRTLARRRQGIVTPGMPALDRLATPEAGFDYFATEVHYRSLAARIITALGGFAVVVVTGDPPASARMLSAALAEATALHLVVGFSCGHEQGRRDLSRFCRAPPAPTSPLLVLDDADRLSDEQLGEIFESIYATTRLGKRRNAAAIMLGHPDFPPRLERLALGSWSAERLFVARLRFRELGTDEVLAFIRHQLRPGEAAKVFTNEIVAALASVSGGDPLVVNQFSRRLLDIGGTTAGDGAVTPAAGSAALLRDWPAKKDAAAWFGRPLPQDSVAERAPELQARASARIWRGIGVKLMMPLGIVFAIATVGLAAAFLAHSVPERIGASGAAAGKASTAFPAAGAATDRAVRPVAGGLMSPAPASLPEEAAIVPDDPARTAASATVAAVAAAAPAIAAPEPLSSTETPAPVDRTAGSRLSVDEVATLLAVLSPTPEAEGATGTPEAAPNTATLPPATPPPVPAAGAAPTSRTVTPEPPPTIPTAPGFLPLSGEMAALVARGDAFFGIGDITSARLFYERAADAGDGRAALKLGKSFDPVFLTFAPLQGVRGDPGTAASWYRRARDLGEAEGEILLKRFEPASSR